MLFLVEVFVCLWNYMLLLKEGWGGVGVGWEILGMSRTEGNEWMTKWYARSVRCYVFTSGFPRLWFFLPPALDKHGKLTEPLGINMAEFPLEPMIAKMLLVSGGNCTVCLCSSYYLQKYMVWLNSKIQCFQTNGCKIKLSDLLELLKATTPTQTYSIRGTW